MSRRLSDTERKQRSDRMRALNADPGAAARRRAAAVGAWSPDRRAAQAAMMKAANSDPLFLARKRAGRALMPPRPIKVPAHTHPLVRGFFADMNAQLATIRDVSARAGIGYDTVRFWRCSMPRLDIFEAALNALDLELAIVPIGTRDENGFLPLRKGQSR